VPDGNTGNVKCPKCGNIFPVAAPTPAFEVVEDEPSPSPPPPKPKSPPKSASAVNSGSAKPPKADFEVVDDDDDRPSKKKPRDDDDDDDDDDRPRSKRRRDDDDDDDRPSKKKKKRRDRDDEEDYLPPTRSSTGLANARTGMQLLSISLWMSLSVFALLALFVLVAWIGVAIPNWLMLIVGLLGLGSWVVGLVGLGFVIGGPPQAKGLATATTVVAGIHLVLAFVIANNEKAGVFSLPAISMLSFMAKFEKIEAITKKLMNETDPAKRDKLMEELRDITGSGKGDLDFSSSRSDMRWNDLATLLPYSDNVLEILIYRMKQFEGDGSGRVSSRDSIGFSDYLLPLAGGLLEAARLVLIVLLIGATARTAKAHDVTDKSNMATIAAGVSAVLPMIVIVIVAAINQDSGKSGGTMKGTATWVAITALLVYLLHLGGLVLPSIMAGGTATAFRRGR
jgi:hypothetical protein